MWQVISKEQGQSLADEFGIKFLECSAKSNIGGSLFPNPKITKNSKSMAMCYRCRRSIFLISKVINTLPYKQALIFNVFLNEKTETLKRDLLIRPKTKTARTETLKSMIKRLPLPREGVVKQSLASLTGPSHYPRTLILSPFLPLFELAFSFILFISDALFGLCFSLYGM